MKVRMHNAFQWILGIGMIPLSAMLWIVAFWFFRWAFYLSISLFYYNAWSVSWYIAWGCMIPLAIDGFRHTRPLFDLEEFTNSSYFDNFMMNSESGYVLSWHYYHPTAAMFWVTQVVLSAPRTMVISIHAFRSLLPHSDAVLHDAARVLAALRNSRRWTPAVQLKKHGAALYLLDRLHLIWTEHDSGELQIRYPAGVK